MSKHIVIPLTVQFCLPFRTTAKLSTLLTNREKTQMYKSELADVYKLNYESLSSLFVYRLHVTPFQNTFQGALFKVIDSEIECYVFISTFI